MIENKEMDDLIEFLEGKEGKSQFTSPWQYGVETETVTRDEDGFTLSTSYNNKSSELTRKDLQNECWRRFHLSPQFNTAVRGIQGRLTGYGFEVTSPIFKIQRAIDEIEQDVRNRLYSHYSKFVLRAIIEGELFLCLTVHQDGFIEIDFIDPSCITGMGTDGDGIVFHPSKTHMPLIYNIEVSQGKYEQIPSIYISRYPELLEVAKDTEPMVKDDLLKSSRNSSKKFKSFGGFNKFIVSWDRGALTKRNVSYLRTTIEWINYYENLKKYEIDHKKASGSYLWNFHFEDPRMFKMWLSLTDEERKKTAILSKKSPGGTIVTPPGMVLDCTNPSLSAIKEQDTDILHMVTSGLNEPEDVTSGQSKGTYASVKASRGPMSDRISDEIADFERYLRFDFWGNIFYLKAAVSNFASTFVVREAVDFKKGEPVFENVKRKPEELLEISFPTSEVIDFESRARAFLGVKHGPIAETLGICNKEIARRMGLGNYGKMRLRKATEDEMYPELSYNVDAEALQEATSGGAEPATQKTQVKRPVVRRERPKPEKNAKE